MKYTFFSLTDLINDSEIGKKQIKSILSDFSCPAKDDLMSIIFDKIREISEVISSVLVYVDCENHESLRRYYEKHGFSRFENGDHDKYICYVIPTKDILKT